MRQAQDLEPDDPFAQGLRQTYNDLDAERRAALAELDAADQTTPALPSMEDAGLLDALPYVTLNLAEAPEPLLRGLFEITNLTVQLHPDTDDVTITIRLPADELSHIADAAETDTMTAPEPPAQQDRRSCADAVRAPGRATCRRSRV